MIGYIILGTAAVLIIALCVWQNSLLVTNDYEVKSDKLPKEFDGMKLTVISDLHKKTFGRDNRRLIYAVKATEPDIIVFPGDLISRFETGLDNEKKLAEKLSKIAPVYYTFGNHEADADEYMRDGIKRLPFNCLLNSSERITRGGEHINLVGVYFDSLYYKNANGGYKGLPRPSLDDLKVMIGEKPEGFTILLAHNPDYLSVYAAWGAELVVSGHDHGGVIKIGGKGLLHPERRLFPKYTSGLYKKENTVMALTAGLGKFRLFNPSEVMTVTLKNS